MSNPNRAWCKDDLTVLEPVEDEGLGHTLRCPKCGITIEMSFDRPTVVVYRWQRPEID